MALATAAEVPRGDEDAAALAAELAPREVDATAAVWDDPAVDWGAFDLVVVRSTWDYPPRRATFVRWAEHVAARTPLANPPAVIRWNTDKAYLAELAAAGVPVVPTTFLPPGTAFTPPAAAEYVVKPAVSAGSKDTLRVGAHEHARAAALVARLHAEGRTAMVQPYLSGIDAHGETAIVFVDGRFSHAVTKGAMLRPGMALVKGLYAPEQLAARAAARAELDLAEAALKVVPAGTDLLYARVDVAPGPAGSPVVLEVEVTEPSLFLGYAEAAASRFAEAIVRRLARLR